MWRSCLEEFTVMTAALALFAQSDDWDHMNGWGGGWMWLWGIAMMVLFAALLIWLVQATNRSAASPTHDAASRAKAILAERYANGDLSTEEFRERVSELR